MTTLIRETSDLPGLPVSTVFAQALRGVPCDVVWGDGMTQDLPVESWVRLADDTDRLMLGSCVGTTIDIGCGPGRMSAQLMLGGHVALGIDVVPEAVAQSRARGVNALRRDVFGHVPGEGRWESALLADGNIGIGGDPAGLLTRARQLVHPGGRIVVDLASAGTGLRVHQLHLRAGGLSSTSFPWAELGPEALPETAAAAGLMVAAVTRRRGRTVAVLTPGTGEDS